MTPKGGSTRCRATATAVAGAVHGVGWRDAIGGAAIRVAKVGEELVGKGRHAAVGVRCGSYTGRQEKSGKGGKELLSSEGGDSVGRRSGAELASYQPPALSFSFPHPRTR